MICFLSRQNANQQKDLGLHASERDRSRVAERANALRRRYDAWIKLQNLYMPTVAAHRELVDPERKSEDDERSVHDACLLLPSDLIGTTTRFSRLLAGHEFRFRVAQAYTSLDELRGLILMRSHLWNSKKRIASGTIQSTRSNTLITKLGLRIKRCAGKYRDIHRRLLKLRMYAPSANSSDSDAFHPLLDSDLAGLSFMEDGPEKDKRSSWIWNVRGLGENADDHGQTGTSEFNACHAVANGSSALRIEFCRARARAHRWQEECLILAEEMRRVVRFWEYEADVWEQRAAEYTPEKACAFQMPADVAKQFPQLMEREKQERLITFQGKAAYAHRQASIRRELKVRAEQRFAPYIPVLDGGVYRDIREFTPA